MPRPFGRIAQRFIEQQDRARRAAALSDFDRFLRRQRMRFSGKLAGSERRIKAARQSIEIPECWEGDAWELVQHRKS